MLATFVIGLREGLEAALIVGIVATFLRKNGTSQHLKQMWIGVAAAVLICLAVGVVLGRTNLPQRQQEMLETVIGTIAVVMVTFMVMWMKGHSRNLKKELESSVGAALDRGSATALVFTAFLAVVREGFETAVFLVASFQSTRSTAQSIGGAVLGIAVSMVLGLLIYRGGLRINLSRFFRATGVVLAVVAAGLVMTVLYHAHEADWINVGQQQAMDLSAFVRPGSVQASLVTGVLGIQAQPTWIEVIAWLLYLIPMLAVVLWPARAMLTRRAAGRLFVTVGAVLLVAAGALAVVVPRSSPVAATESRADLSGAVGSGTNLTDGAPLAGTTLTGTATITITARRPGGVTARIDGSLAGAAFSGSVELAISGGSTVGGRQGVSYSGNPISARTDPAAVPATVSGAQLAALNGGRLPIGLRSADLRSQLPAAFSDSWQPTLALAADGGSPIDLQIRLVRTVSVTGSTGAASTAKVLDTRFSPDRASAGILVGAATEAADRADRREILGQALPGLSTLAGVIFLIIGAPMLLRPGRRRPAPVPVTRAAAPPAVPGGPALEVVNARAELVEPASAGARGAG